MQTKYNPVAFYSDYAKKWSKDAQHLSSNGYYEWMSKPISDRKEILEIGCGSGQSTAHLLKSGHRVIAIEENPICLNATFDLLKRAYSVKKIQRGTAHSYARSFEISYNKIPSTSIDSYDLILIEGNILDDSSLDSFLATLQLDAVICWLIGTQGENIVGNRRFQKFEIRNFGEYRLRIQNKLYSECHNWLKIGGLLNLVDRGQLIDSTALADDIIGSHKEQALGTHMVVAADSLSQIEYDLAQGGVGYALSPGLLGDVPENPKVGLTSISATRRF